MEWAMFAIGVGVGAALASAVFVLFVKDRYWREYQRFLDEFERGLNDIAEHQAETRASIKAGARRAKGRFKLNLDQE